MNFNNYVIKSLNKYIGEDMSVGMTMKVKY